MNRARFLLPLAFAGLIFAGCGQQPGRITSATGPEISKGDASPSLNVDLNSLEYETFYGTLSPESGGALGTYLKTWGKNCWFSVVVPQGAMDPNDPPVNFSMSVPTKASYLAHSGTDLDSTIVIRLDPDGYPFRESIRIQATWMPWAPPPPDSVNVWDGYASQRVPVQYVPSIDRYQIIFWVDHFSDWEVGPEPH
jgi:hypothetical protein